MNETSPQLAGSVEHGSALLNSTPTVAFPWQQGWPSASQFLAPLEHRRLTYDHPKYLSLFNLFGMDKCDTHVHIDDIKRTFGAVFDVRLSFHRPGTLGTAVRAIAPELRFDDTNIMLYVARYGEDLAKCLAAFVTYGPHDKLVDQGSVLRAMGNYCEERLLYGQRRCTIAETRDTAFMDAFCAVARCCPDLPKEAIPFVADAVVGWVNAIWLCWIFKLDPRAIVVGMVLDDISNPAGASDFVIRVFPQWKNVLMDRDTAENLFRNVDGPGFGTCFVDKDVYLLCRQIDRATRSLLRAIS